MRSVVWVWADIILWLTLTFPTTFASNSAWAPIFFEKRHFGIKTIAKLSHVSDANNIGF